MLTTMTKSISIFESNGDSEHEVCSSELSNSFKVVNRVDSATGAKWRVSAESESDSGLRTASLNSINDIVPLSVDPSQAEPESRVMVIYTGGTIGMRLHNGVYRPDPEYLPRALSRNPSLNDVEYVNKFYRSYQLKPFVLPAIKNETKRIVYWVHEYEPLLDSSDMTFDDWIQIASDIMSNYENYDGFVVLHGTDTLCYTASAVSFMFENLGKTIIFTGSQIPIAEVRSDGQENLIGSLILAGNYEIPEVAIYFNNKLMRGNRCIKLDNSALDAFHTPNMQPLAVMEISIRVDWNSIFRSPVPIKVSLHTKLNRNVGLLRIFPSISLEHVKAFLSEHIQGVVLQTYGAGNIPSQRTDILQALKEASDRGVIIVNCSQCTRGAVVTHYACGKVLHDAGVISGHDLTAEAALTKLAYVLGRTEWTIEKKRKMMERNLRGELTVVSVDRLRNNGSTAALKDLEFVRQFAAFMRASSSQELQLYRDALYPPLINTAASNGDIALLDELWKAGAHLGVADYDCRTAMHIAASTGLVNVLNYLLVKGISVHSKDRWNDTPLLNAIRNRHYDCIEVLKKAGAHLTLSSVALGTELCSLASRGDVATIAAWKMAGANLNNGDYDNRTALHVAAAKGFDNVVRFLLENGADKNLRDIFGNVALDESLKRNYDNITTLLKGTAALELDN